MKKIILITFISLCFSANFFSQQIDTKIFFQGNIISTQDTIEIIVSIENNIANLFVPEQFLYAMPSTSIFYDEDSLACFFNKIPASLFVKRIDNSEKFIGVWKQGKAEIDLKMEIKDNSEFEFLQRPQTPKPPFPYLEKEICVDNKEGNSVLCGTLTIPDTLKKYPLVILVTGSGPQDRNEEIGGHKTFLVIADYLCRNGIAVFRYDDRGVGKSKGNFANSTTYDFMTDAEAVFNFMKNYPNIDINNIGILGHSEGGLIAFMLAAKNPKNLKFIISLAGPGVPMKQLLITQLKDINKSMDLPQEHIEILAEMQEELLNLATKNYDLVKLRKEIKIRYEKYSKIFTEEERNKYKINDQAINTAVMQLSSPWMKYFTKIDPKKYLKKIKISVYAINGDKDLQVNCADNIFAIQKYLKKIGSHIVIYEGLNHLFQDSETGDILEYYKNSNTISPTVLEGILSFIKSKSKQ